MSAQANSKTQIVAPVQQEPARAGQLQRKCACGQHTIAGGECDACGKQRLQRRSAGQAEPAQVPPLVHEVLRSPGQPLDTDTRAFMEPRFGHDFSHVRVHTDARAAESARAVNALAYTVGRDVIFAAGQYMPGVSAGRGLLAHELTHVVQQRSVAHSSPAQLTMGAAHDADELQADSIAQETLNSWSGPEAPTPSSLGGAERIQSATRGAVQTSRGPKLQRSRSGFFSTIGGFFSSIFHGIFGFSDERLKSYLEGLNKTGDIEGDPDSDDMARAVVGRWMTDRSAFFVLTPKLKRLLIREMLDGPTTKGDEDAILDLLETSRDEDLGEIFTGGGVTPKQLQSDLDDKESQGRLLKFFAQRYVGGLEATLKGKFERRPFFNLKAMETKNVDEFIEKHFTGTDRDLARKILNDLRAVKGDDLDFENEEELRNEVFKRLRVSQLMQESQTDKAFDYPESLTEDCPGYDPNRPPNILKHARVNKAAKPYWSDVILHPTAIYYFQLTPEGKQHAFDALEKLFTHQDSICDRTLIHCDYLTSVIHLRAFAESIGVEEFNTRVRSDAIQFYLTYYGADFLTATDVPGPRGRIAGPASAKSVSLQQMRPASKEDLVIGDHVVFWNHLAYDALTVMRPGPWRLENAVLVDKNEKGEDKFEGHGAPSLGNTVAPGTEEDMLNELAAVYNRQVEPAEDLTRQVEAGYLHAEQNLKEKFPQVEKASNGKWIVKELPKNSYRPKKFYELRQLMNYKDPELIGLKDEIDPNKMGIVERPVESRKEPLPKP